MLNRACLETDLHSFSKYGGQSSNCKSQETVTGSFCTIIQEVAQSALGTLEEEDRMAIHTQLNRNDQEFETVDSIRFIKPNKDFYNWLVKCWLLYIMISQKQICAAAALHLQQIQGPA